MLLAVATGVAVAKTMERIGVENSEIKWPNDIMINGKKVCGILTEAGFESSGDKLDYVILGIGINIAPPNDGFPKELENIAGAGFFAADRSIREYADRIWHLKQLVTTGKKKK